MDLLIRNGTIVDGTGAPAFLGHVGVQGDRIAGVWREVENALPSADRVIDAQGLIVCPGFIDAHAHDDLAVLHDRDMLCKLAQGVTTTIVGNCGLAPTPAVPSSRDALRAYVEPVLGRWDLDEREFGFATFGDYRDRVSQTPRAVHVGSLAAHGTLRIAVKGFDASGPTSEEMQRMQELLQNAMEHGALGLSLGLMYAPGCFATPEELRALGEVVRANGGVVTAHIRGEGDLLLASLDEMFELARAANVPVHISHLKAVGIPNWGTVQNALRAIEKAREEGLDITCDVYPYAAGSTTITSLLPPFALREGLDHALALLSDEKGREAVRTALTKPGKGWDNVALLTGFDRVVLASTPCEQLKAYEGMTIQEIADEMGCDGIDAYFDVMRTGGARDTIVIHHMDEADVLRVVSHPLSVIGSDGLPSRSGHPHPRLYGTFARYIGHYVRDEAALELSRAIHKATGCTAARFGLRHRGILAPGNFADLALFVYDELRDMATYAQPRQLARGVQYVFVNGESVIEQTHRVERFPGQFLTRAN